MKTTAVTLWFTTLYFTVPVRALHPHPEEGNAGGIAGQCNGVTIRVHAGHTKPLMERLTKSFVNETGAKVELTMRDHTWNDNDINIEQDDDIEHGNKWGYKYDVYLFHNGRWTSQASKGHFEAITDEVAKYPEMEWSDVYPRAREATSVYDGEVYGIPIDADVILMAYRKDIFEKANIKVPSTWDEWYAASKALQEGGHTKFGSCLSDKLGDVTSELFWAYAAPWLQSQGTSTGMWFDPDNMEPKVDSEAFKEALKMYKKIHQYSQHGTVDHGTPEDRSAEEAGRKYGQNNRYGYLETLTAWSRGDCGMFINYPGPIKWAISDTLPVTIDSISGDVVTTKEKHGLDHNAPTTANEMRVFVYASGGTPLTRGGVPVPDSTTVFVKVEGDKSLKLFDTHSDMSNDVNAITFDAGSGTGTRLKSFNYGDQVGIALVPGSTSVLGKDGKSAAPCDTTLCPFTNRGWQGASNPSISTAPYYAGGGQSVFMRSGMEQQITDCAFRYMVFLSEFRNSLKIVASGEGLLDPYRKKHFPDFNKKGTPEYNAVWQEYEQYGWKEDQLEQYKGVTETVWGHDNGAFDIRIVGYQDYVRVPDLVIQPFLAGDMTEDAVIRLMAEKHRQATKNYGLDKQRKLYRAALGLGPYIPPTKNVQSSEGLPIWVLFLILGLVGAVMFIFMVYKGIQFYKEKRRLQKEFEAAMDRKLEEGRKAVTTINFPMVLISASNFLSLTDDERNTLHEGLRNTGKLLFLDISEAVAIFKNKGKSILFFSYQWLSWEVSGPNPVQWKAMKESVKSVMDNKNKSEEEVFIWLDIFSIPQSHPTLKMLAVNTLYVYASFADDMVIIAPDSKHANTGEEAGSESYKSRTWCRAEQVAYFCANPSNTLYLKTQDSMAPVPDGWISTVSRIFEGNLTCCRLQHVGGAPCDRLSLVPTLMGLYFKVYLERLLSGDADKQQIWNFINNDKAAMFPKTFQYKTKSGTSTQTLFGDLLERVEKKAERELQAAPEGNDTEMIVKTIVAKGKAVDNSGLAKAHGSNSLHVPDAAPVEKRQSASQMPADAANYDLIAGV